MSNHLIPEIVFKSAATLGICLLPSLFAIAETGSDPFLKSFYFQVHVNPLKAEQHLQIIPTLLSLSVGESLCKEQLQI